MKYALILETDECARERLVKLVGWLGYSATPVSTAEEALAIASTTHLDLIFTSILTLPDERRQLPGELKRVAPESAVIVIAANDEEYKLKKLSPPIGVSAVVPRQPTIDVLRRILESNIEGFGLHAVPCLPSFERRRIPK